MSLFRKKCDSKKALGLLHVIVISEATTDASLASYFPDIANHDRLRHEFIALRLFAVVVASQETQYRDWQERGRELFDDLFETTLRSIMAEYQESELITRRLLAERIKYYSIARNMSMSIDELGNETGKSFGMLFSEMPSDYLSRLGRGVFFRAFDQTLARHADFKLI